jgi:hypothetical protein
MTITRRQGGSGSAAFESAAISLVEGKGGGLHFYRRAPRVLRPQHCVSKPRFLQGGGVFGFQGSGGAGPFTKVTSWVCLAIANGPSFSLAGGSPFPSVLEHLLGLTSACRQSWKKGSGPFTDSGGMPKHELRDTSLASTASLSTSTLRRWHTSSELTRIKDRSAVKFAKTCGCSDAEHPAAGPVQAIQQAVFPSRRLHS